MSLKRTIYAAAFALSACVTTGDEADLDTGTADEAVTAAPAPAPTWQPLVNQAPFGAGVALLLTDGTLMVQDVGTPNWWRLTPDASGSYINGTWSQLASMPGGYAPLYFASAVLPDGRVIIEGGEYLDFNPAWSNQGAIYDPVTNTWTTVTPPAGWQTIGDAQSVVLANGQFMLANCCSTEAALLDPKTLSWTPTGLTGKADSNNEEGWTLLADGTVLTVDASNTANPTESELYIPARGKKPAKWVSAGSTIVPLADLDADGGGSHEIGPAVLRPDGTVIVFGATGHNAIYDTHTKAWASAPDFPIIDGEGQLDVADGPATLLPNGHVLVATSPEIFNSSTHFFEVDGTTLTQVEGPPAAPFNSSYHQNLLLLPSGEVFATDFSADIEIYTSTPPAGCQHDVAPEIEWVATSLRAGSSYTLHGERLNGVSQAVAYGDDAQAATNYPLVRITNRKTRHVVFARTHDHTSMSIDRDTESSTKFDVPATAEKGPSELVVIANGTPSSPVTVNIR
ncbi:MAG: hypothetical protein K8W52_40900 [Deltaproteobacteria bacterium]|nr:hypothetical protein [Deltaproteobacteria bacterium]